MNQAVGQSEETWENINVECRPMNIAEQYSDLMATSWLDAKEELDQCQGFKEEEKCRLLCRVLTVRHMHVLISNFIQLHAATFLSVSIKYKLLIVIVVPFEGERTKSEKSFAASAKTI